MNNSNFDFFQKFINLESKTKNNIKINWDEINNDLNKIESKLKNDEDFSYIPMLARKIVEQVLGYMCSWSGIEFTKNNKIYSLNEVFKDKRIESSIWTKSSFRFVIESGNSTAHDYYSFNKCEVITVTKKLRACLLFFITHILEINEFKNFEIDIFDENIYYIDKRHNHEIISKKEINENHKIFEKSVNDIHVNMIEIVSFLLGENRKFEIPMYQRGYDWDNENIDEFLDDILSRNKDKKTHYFGIVACKKEKINNDEKIKILDGQQRLTTSLIFIKALKDFYFNKFNKKIYEDNDYKAFYKFFYPTINNKEILFNEIISNIANSKDQNQKNNDILGKLSFAEIENKYGKDKDYRIKYKLIGAYFEIIDWLKKLIEEKSEDTHEDVISEIALTFISKFQIGLIQFDEDKFRIKQELEIFENLNSKGKSLSILDLVKNYLFSLCDEKKLSDDNDSQEINIMFEKYISNQFEGENESNEFLSSFVHLFSGKEINSKKKSKFLTSFKDTIEKEIQWNLVNKHFNNKIENIEIESYKDIIKFISEFINSYIKLKNIQKNAKEYEHIDHSLNLLIRTINAKKLTPLFAVDFLIVYFAIMESRKNQKNINEILLTYKNDIYKIHLISIKYIIISYIRTGQGDSSLKRKIFGYCNEIIGLINNCKKNISIKEIFNELKNKLFNKRISSIEMMELLLKSDDKIKTFNNTIFMLIEINKRQKDKTKYSSELFVNNKHTIEHIMPKDPIKWEKDIKNWNNLPYSKNHNEFKQKHNEHLEKIGNLLLIPKGLNSSLKNDEFLNKINYYDKYAQELFLYKNDDNDKIDISRKNKWSFNDIDERTQGIKEYMVYEIFNDCLD